MNVPTLDGPSAPVCTDICSRHEAIEVASLADRGALFAAVMRASQGEDLRHVRNSR